MGNREFIGIRGKLFHHRDNQRKITSRRRNRNQSKILSPKTNKNRKRNKNPNFRRFRQKNRIRRNLLNKSESRRF